ncbi:hypothetical protein [Pelosinus propionicus]|uniref:Uncharacterized protein n=1 Tax=Pelosinus propionicus DSM 13327 TaxID=1123291 RepID=A0A1I4LRM6_9FIRM|nr:hypothetical protein [Pelosinus propionicus]SFL93585.1 hypothetical protein SAMN04490355_102657 [Pelosinus propionicus DSM 13327]
MNLGISGISFSPQSNSRVGQNDKSEVKNNQGKRQYVTEQEGAYECTYVVIGENFKILIGRVPKNKDEEQDTSKTEAAGNQGIHALSNDQTLMGHQMLAAAKLSNKNLQQRIQAADKYDTSSYYDSAKLDAKG